MTPKEIHEAMYRQFNKSANEFCRKTNGCGCEIANSYKGRESDKNIKSISAKISYNSYFLEFRYTVNGIISYSILECLACFEKSEDALKIPLPFIVDFCDIDILTPLCIPMISNEDGMREAFDTLGCVLTDLMPELADISCNAERKQLLFDYFCDEVMRLLRFKFVKDCEVDDYDYQIFATRFSSGAFAYILRGEREKALKALKKNKDLFSYEERMKRLWESGKTMDVSRLPHIVENTEYINSLYVPKVDFREFLSHFIAWILLCVPLSLVYFGIYLLFAWMISQDAVYVTGIKMNWPCCVFAGFLTSVPISYFTRHWFYKKLFRKKYDKYREVDSMINTASSDKICGVLLRIIIVLCIAGLFLYENCNLTFKNDGFTDNTKFFSLKGEYHTYDEIDFIKYEPEFVNDFGDTIDIPSYSIIMKNGEIIDLRPYDDVEYYEKTLLALLEEQGVEVKK